ncbi:MAG: LysR family transcriptional regulator, partial [Pseudomonadota bacterium]
EARTLRLTPLLVLRFVAVYEHRSIRGAASALDIAQPQISTQIAGLEDLLRTPLFARSPAGLKPTAAARIFYQGALKLSDLCAPLIRRGDLLFRQALGTTHLGTVAPVTTASALCARLADLCRHWRATYPTGSIRISADMTDQLLARLRRNELHAALIDTPDVPPGLSARRIAARPLMLAVGRDWGDPGLGQFAVETLRAMPVALPSRQSSLRLLADGWAAQQGLDLSDVVEVESMTVITDLIARHGYASILPGDAADASDGIAFLPLPGAPDLVQNLVWRHEMAGNKHVERLVAALA